MSKQTAEGALWTTRKGQIIIIGVVAVLAIALGGTALGLDEEQRGQAIDALKWLFGAWLAGHTVTDVAFSRNEPPTE